MTFALFPNLSHTSNVTVCSPGISVTFSLVIFLFETLTLSNSTPSTKILPLNVSSALSSAILAVNAIVEPLISAPFSSVIPVSSVAYVILVIVGNTLSSTAEL